MIHFKKLAAITTAVFALSAVLMPMEAHAYTKSEIRLMLGIGTEADAKTALTERDILSSLSSTPVYVVEENGNETEANAEEAVSNTIFNADFYADTYPDLKAAFGNDSNLLYNHFVTTGMAEGRQGSANFNVLVYKEKNPDLQAVFQDNLTEYYNHFVNGGYLENRTCR